MESAGPATTSLAEALFGKARQEEVWTEIRFDSPPSYLDLRRGEVVLEALVSTGSGQVSSCSNVSPLDPKPLCLPAQIPPGYNMLVPAKLLARVIDPSTAE